MTFDLVQPLPDDVRLLLATPPRPGIVYEEGSWSLSVDVPADAASRPDFASTIGNGSERDARALVLDTSLPAAGMPSAFLGDFGDRDVGVLPWPGWEIGGDHARPVVRVLCLGDPRADGAAVQLVRPRLLILGDEGTVPASDAGWRALRTERTLRRALSALDSGEIERVCGADLRLRAAPQGDEARAQILSVLEDVRRAARHTPPHPPSLP